MRYFSMYPLILAVAACVGVVDACSGGDVKLDDHSANGHRREAAGERAMAKSEAAQYDPSAEQVQQVQAGGQQIPDVNTPILVTVNPTEAHLVAAEAHKRHAEQHENAAKKLIAFENAACKKVPTEDKLACPTLLHDTMQPLANGLRMHTGSTRMPKMLATMQCHLAFARANGYADDALCPFAIKGVTADLSPDQTSIDLTSKDPAAIAALHQLIALPARGI